MTSPQTSAKPRPWRLALLVLAGAVAVVLLFRFDPAKYAFFPSCAFYRLTGLYCPGCGAQRALHSLAHGDVLMALHFNPLFILALPFLAFAAWRFVQRAVFDQLPTRMVIRPRWIYLLAGVIIAFGVVRNLPFPPFTWLAPP